MARVYRINNQRVRLKPGWAFIDKINARSTVSFEVVELDPFTEGLIDDVVPGMEFEMFKDATETETLFKGIVKKSRDFDGTTNKRHWNIKVADNSAKADKRIIANVYTNELFADIVRDIITEKLTEEGVSEGTIDDGPVVSKAVFNYIYVAQALDYLKRITGFYWLIDNNDDLNFTARDKFLAPFELLDDTQHERFNRTRSMDQYRNTEYTRGGNVETAPQTDEEPTPEPDGKSRTFVLRFPLAAKPVIKINSVAIDPNDIGVNGKESNKKWYYEVGSQTITQDSSETVLISTDVIEVDYTGFRRLFLLNDNPTEIDNRKAIETGTSGIYDHLSIETSITTEDQGVEYNNGLLETYGVIENKITYSTNEPGLRAGMLQKVVKTRYNINAEYLIEQVTMRPDGPNDITYDVVALDGASLGGWEEFFKDITRQQAEFIINENEVVVRLQNQNEANEYVGSYNIQTYKPPVAAETLLCSESLICGNPVVTEDDIND